MYNLDMVNKSTQQENEMNATEKQVNYIERLIKEKTMITNNMVYFHGMTNFREYQYSKYGSPKGLPRDESLIISKKCKENFDNDMIELQSIILERLRNIDVSTITMADASKMIDFLKSGRVYQYSGWNNG